eukprot:9235820-Ditylum_brightwellii.AAC.1
MKPRHTLEKGSWPRQTRPNLDTWEKRQKSLIKTICNKSGMLNIPLGKWTIVTQRWEGYHHKEHTYKKEGKWYKHLITTKAREEANVPSGDVPITDAKEGNMLMFTPPTPRKQKKSKESEKIKTFHDFLRIQPRWIRQIIENAKKKEGQEKLKETLMSEEGIWIGSDGGIKTQDGTFGWVIATATSIMWGKNSCALEIRKLTETLRTESIGLLSAIIFIKLYTKYHNTPINSNKVIHSCDNMGVVQRMKWMEVRNIKTAND